MLSRFTPIFRLFGHCRYTFCKVKRNVPTSQSVSFLDRLFAHQWDGWFWTRKEEEKKRKRYEINRSKVQSFLSLYDYYWKFDTFHFNSLEARAISLPAHTQAEVDTSNQPFKCDLRERSVRQIIFAGCVACSICQRSFCISLFITSGSIWPQRAQ